jgi:hypothetical protein
MKNPRSWMRNHCTRVDHSRRAGFSISLDVYTDSNSMAAELLYGGCEGVLYLCPRQDLDEAASFISKIARPP